jgi:hypothetical protein
MGERDRVRPRPLPGQAPDPRPDGAPAGISHCQRATYATPPGPDQDGQFLPGGQGCRVLGTPAGTFGRAVTAAR